MGKPLAKQAAPAPPRYRDEPDADGLSLHTTSSDYEYDDLAELPSYHDSEAAVAEGAAGPSFTDVRDLLPDSYPAIKQPGDSGGWRVHENSKPINGNEMTIRMDKRLTDPQQLFDYIQNYLRVVPPNPGIRIVGHHFQTVERDKKKETERVVDFDIKFSLQAYLPRATNPSDGGASPGWDARVACNSDKVYRGSWRATRAKGHPQANEIDDLPQRELEHDDLPQPDLMEWCRDYCESKAKLKIFRVTRNVPGIQQEFIRQQLEHLIRSTHYRGHITITFPIDEKHVDIYSPHVINRWRISWIRFIFYFTFLWIITWPILFFMTKYWTVYQVNFRFSWCHRETSVVDGQNMERMVGRYAVLSEKTWLGRHQALIRSLVVDQYQGDATDLPTDVRVRERSSDRRMSWAGNANEDAVSLLRGSVNALNALQGRAPRGDNQGWGADTR